jgi:hypothetical protein
MFLWVSQYKDIEYVDIGYVARINGPLVKFYQKTYLTK